jgi:hypothetical protein
MKHAMLDIETLGTTPGCIVLTVGAARFDPYTGETADHFYEAISFKNSVLNGLVCNPSTHAWWQKQHEEARKAAFAGEKSLSDVAAAFCSWSRNSAIEHWWSQGSDFDFPIWEAAMKAAKREAPWKYWAKRDTRTIYAVAGFDPDTLKREGTYHNALDDSLHQVCCVHECYRLIGLVKSDPIIIDDLEDM